MESHSHHESSDNCSKKSREEPINAQDLTAIRKEYLFKPPGFIIRYFERFIQDKRDLIMVFLAFNINVTVLPFSLFLFMLNEVPMLLGLTYVLFVYILYIQRFALMLHYSEHRQLFPNSSVWNLWIPYVLCPFFGIPSGVYFVHHVVMHHQENNVGNQDISSTEQYQRDSFFSFLHYWFRWMVFIWFQLPFYLFQRRRWYLLNSLILSLTVWFICICILYRAKPSATFWVFLLPVFLTQLMFAFGNYSQHMFVNPEKPHDNYNLTYCCINTTDNQYSFNDGYHITHHVNARLHWSLMPERFLKNLDQYVDSDALVFDGIGFFDVGFLTLTRQWKKLSQHVVHLGSKESKRTEDQVITILKHRCKPIWQK